jgi:predicted membrane-bound mannosyltransferase
MIEILLNLTENTMVDLYYSRYLLEDILKLFFSLNFLGFGTVRKLFLNFTFVKLEDYNLSFIFHLV